MTHVEPISHDKINKKLFSEPRMIEDLLRGFLKADWVNDLDFTTLERVNTGFISSTLDLKKRDSDIIWKIRWKEQWLHLFIILEFQSSVDKYMAVRVLSYMMLLYEQIIQSDSKILLKGKLPPILPIVLYNGVKNWTASLSLDDLFIADLPPLLKKYQPNFKYWLMETSKEQIPDNLENTQNFVSLLFQLEQAKKPQEIEELIQRLGRAFKSIPKMDSLIRVFRVYLNHNLLVQHAESENNLENEKEDNFMSLRERALKWEFGTFEEGHSEGRFEGERLIIERLIHKKFGKLLPAQQEILFQLPENVLLQISEKILFASTVDEVLNCVPVNFV